MHILFQIKQVDFFPLNPTGYAIIAVIKGLRDGATYFWQISEKGEKFFKTNSYLNKKMSLVKKMSYPLGGNYKV
jgi:hypothetical protein